MESITDSATDAPAILKGMNYSPSWRTWQPGGTGQLSDADFFNDSFQALWNKGENGSNANRDDLGTIAAAGVNLIRLYNWGPTRGWDATKKVGSGHINALNYANSLNIQVIVPVSNYFLSDDQYAWNGTDPNQALDFSSAPEAIQSDLQNFITSISTNGVVNPAVHSIMVGNEVDLNDFAGQGTSGSVAPHSRIARVNWWIKNLNEKMPKQLLYSCPISNGDQGGTKTTPASYWFGALVNGVTTSTPLPVGTKGGPGHFAKSAPGISSVSGWQSWYYNSVNIYQQSTQLSDTLGQYDVWKSNPTNTLNWPGQQFSVPLMLSEIGYNRVDNSQVSQDHQYTALITNQLQVIQTYVTGNLSTLLNGFCVFEFNDEKAYSTHWGINMELSSASSYEASTGACTTSFATWPSIKYPVTALTPVRNSAGTSIIADLKNIFS